MECDNLKINYTASKQSRDYCQSGGVAEAVKKASDSEISTMLVNGIDKKQLRLLMSISNTKKCYSKLIEVMACEGGCIAGPCSYEFPKDAKRFYERNTEGMD